MRPITDRKIARDIEVHIGGQNVEKADAFPVSTYRQLVEQIAMLSYLNKDHLLFFRGQGRDYKNRTGSSTFYPAIYRGDYLTQQELNERFRVLDHAARSLRDLFRKNNIEGEVELRWKKHIQWSILQHYEVCATPLLDLTHSLRAACSFAQLEAKEGYGYVIVFGLPYVMNRISHNSEHDIVNVRLLSICPPEALRPYFQEGYLTATEDITNEYDRKADLDFNRRLIAKFSIPRGSKFWGRGFSRIPRSVLYPRGDSIAKLCRAIELDVQSGLLPGDLGKFVQIWSDLETSLLEMAKAKEPRLFTVRGAIERLSKDRMISRDLAYELHELRKFRNQIIHEPKEIDQDQLEDRIEQLVRAKSQLEHDA